MKPKQPTAEKVIDVALALLRNEGDRGVTMRRVAQEAGMSLSNVQYHFRTKDVLLRALADRYFQRCLEEIRAEELTIPGEEVRPILERALGHFLSHGLEVSEMCRIFREYWALATRNEEIASYLVNYYRDMAEILKDQLRPLARNDEALDEAVSLLIPLVEGYTITCPSLPCEIDRMTHLTTELLLSALTEEGATSA